MNWIEALILGLIQGLTEFLPVSSSGHLELGKAILGVEYAENLTFTVVVHGATVLSTIVVFWPTIRDLLLGLFQWKWNDSTKYIAKLLFSMIPVVIIGLLLEDQIESLFAGNVMFVGFMLLITAGLLAFTYYAKDLKKEMGFRQAFIVGIAQALAVLPGISRSGSTIATSLYLGVNKEEAARFSFLMVLIPILGANAKDLISKDFSAMSSPDILPLIIGFVAAFFSGLLACKWMISLVKRGKLIYFAFYCLIIGIIAIIAGI